MGISLTSYARADICASKSALEAVKAKDGNEKATKGIAAYHAQQAIEKILKFEIYKVDPDISPRKMYTHKIYDLHFSVGLDSIEKALRLAEKWLGEIEP